MIARAAYPDALRAIRAMWLEKGSAWVYIGADRCLEYLGGAAGPLLCIARPRFVAPMEDAELRVLLAEWDTPCPCKRPREEQREAVLARVGAIGGLELAWT